MTTLTVWKFHTSEGADDAARMLEELSRKMVIVVHDAATVTWPEGTKKPKTHQLHGLAGAGAMGGAFWGFLFGLIFLVPLLGAAVGAAAGGFSASLADVGIDDGFINRIRDQVTPGTSALFLLTSGAVMDKVQDAFKGLDMGELIYTNLSDEQEAALREVFAE